MNRSRRNAFTMVELIFVIVVMGILAKFGVELLKQTYENYTRSMIHNRLESKTEAAIQQIANRLSYRIRDSLIATTGPAAAFNSLANANANDNVIEWIGLDLDGWNAGNYSGLIDLDDSNTTALASPGTTSVPAGAAILFMGANVDVSNSFGWHGSGANALHPVTASANVLTPTTPFIIGDDIFEYYQVADSAYALALIGDEIFYYDNYQPWNGGTYNPNSPYFLVDDVSTVNVQKVGDVIKIVLCLSNVDFMQEGNYSICKTKVVF